VCVRGAACGHVSGLAQQIDEPAYPFVIDKHFLAAHESCQRRDDWSVLPAMLGAHQTLGVIARHCLKVIPKSATIRILSGPNRGFRWVVRAGQHGCWLGRYERNHAALVASIARPGMIAFDVGAHSGYYTLLLSRRVGPRGRVFAFEPNSTNVASLRHHLLINDIRNVEVIQAAVSDKAGHAHFHDDGYISRLADIGRTVRTVRLDDFPSPDFVKMDIEGAEGIAMHGACQLLSSKVTTWFIELHAEPGRSACTNALLRAGYKLQWTTANEFLARP
jgi:FkbM family methyltransferase